MAITISGVSLPSIPKSDLKTHPYAVIAKVSKSGVSTYALIMSDGQFGYIPPGVVSGVMYGAYVSNGNSIGYIMDTSYSSWHTRTEFAAKVVIGYTGTSTLESALPVESIVWSNCDIMKVSSVNIDTGDYSTSGTYFECTLGYRGTKGDDITIGTDTLPGVSSDLLEVYPYVLIGKIDGIEDGEPMTLYFLLAATEPGYYVDKTLSGYGTDVIGSPGASIAYAWTSAVSGLTEWMWLSVFASLEGLPIGNNVNLGGTSTVTSTASWSNHDIYKLKSVNINTGSFSVGDLYMKANSYTGGLPDVGGGEGGGGSSGDNIEEGITTRMSIGYDLWKAIVDETRRLSGTIELLNGDMVLTMLKSVSGGSSGGGGMITSNFGLTYASMASSKGVTITPGSNRGYASFTLEMSILKSSNEADGEVVM